MIKVLLHEQRGGKMAKDKKKKKKSLEAKKSEQIAVNEEKASKGKKKATEKDKKKEKKLKKKLTEHTSLKNLYKKKTKGRQAVYVKKIHPRIRRGAEQASNRDFKMAKTCHCQRTACLAAV